MDGVTSMPPLPGRRARARSWVLRTVPHELLLRPFELFIAGLCVLSAIPLLLGAPPPESIDAVLPPWLVKAWGIELLVGSTLVVYGLLKPRTVWQRIGYSLLGPAAAVYGIAIGKYRGQNAGITVGVFLAFAAACAVRSWVLRLAERAIHDAIHDLAADALDDGEQP